MKPVPIVSILTLAALCAGQRVAAQLSGSNAVGDFGLKSGSQAPAGLYLGYFLYDDSATRIAGGANDVDIVERGAGQAAHPAEVDPVRIGAAALTREERPALNWKRACRVTGGFLPARCRVLPGRARSSTRPPRL